MRIAQVSPLFERVPPVLYGGTERVVYYLTEELVRRGHDVTLFASGDSQTSARLISPCPRAIRLDGNVFDPGVYHMLELGMVLDMIKEFDIVHFHLDYFHFPLTRFVSTPIVTTLHGRLDLPELQPLYNYYPEVNLISVSNSQRELVPDAHWVGTVYHGYPPELLPFHSKSEGYLAFLGRISPEKRPDLAIEVAKRAGIPLKIAAKVDPIDRTYFENQIKPMLNHPLIEYVGEISDSEKGEFLGRAKALLFPIDWPEPFGLVMIEALACGTPVVARPCGSVPEIVKDGRTGFLEWNIDALVDAVKKVDEIDRRVCRMDMERRFSVKRMADQYLNIYWTLIKDRYEFPHRPRHPFGHWPKAA